jgi:hypothetical protein
MGYVPKIGDFGLSVKYSTPIIGCKDCTIDVPNGYADELPGWQMDSYDMLYFTLVMFSSYGKYSGLLCRVMGYILRPDDKVSTFAEVDRMMFDSKGYPTAEYSSIYNPNRKRPTFQDHPIRAWHVFENAYLYGDALQTSQPQDQIIKMGSLETSSSKVIRIPSKVIVSKKQPIKGKDVVVLKKPSQTKCLLPPQIKCPSPPPKTTPHKKHTHNVKWWDGENFESPSPKTRRIQNLKKASRTKPKTKKSPNKRKKAKNIKKNYIYERKRKTKMVSDDI